nr:endonuclease/exonuclease/phosphatase family protein [Phytoactinopolyspora alkaliphila]
MQASQTTAATAQVKVITYNLCGAASHCANPGEIVNRTGYLIDEVLAYDADVVMLTEVCYLQYAHIRDQLVAKGYDHKWAASRPQVANCTPPGGNTADLAAQNALRFGNVILAKSSLTNREEIRLTETNYGTAAISKALCADAGIPGLGQGKVRACVAHPRAGKTGPAARARWDELTAWAAEVDRYLHGNDQLVILGGDFNAEPGDRELDPFYALDGIGEFIELDMTDSAAFTPGCTSQQATRCRSGAPTFIHPTDGPKKLDYIFFSSSHVNDFGAGVRPIGPNSDHHLFRGWANVTVN